MFVDCPKCEHEVEVQEQLKKDFAAFVPKSPKQKPEERIAELEAKLAQVRNLIGAMDIEADRMADKILKMESLCGEAAAELRLIMPFANKSNLIARLEAASGTEEK